MVITERIEEKVTSYVLSAYKKHPSASHEEIFFNCFFWVKNNYEDMTLRQFERLMIKAISGGK